MQVILPLFTAFLLAAAGTAAVRGVARRFGLVVEPREDRWHRRSTALYGGVAIALAVLVVVVLHVPESLLAHHPALAITGAAAFLFLAGLVDDARGLAPVTKLILQLAAATLLLAAGATIPVTPWNPVNGLVTMFWFVGIVNALNLLDNMDGVAAGVAAVAALGFAVFFVVVGDPVLATVAIAVAGAAGGFLVFNFKPASIFMGDTGSLFLGACLAGLGTAYPAASGNTGVLALLVPSLILLVPILDTTLVTVTRTINDRRISVGGRDHSTHRLVTMGFSEAGAAIFLYGSGAMVVLVAWLVAQAGPTSGLWFGLLFLTGTLIFTGYLGRLHRYDEVDGDEGRRRGAILRGILLKRRGLELLLDVVLFGVAYYGAFVIYHDASMTRDMGLVVNSTLGIAIVAKLAAFHYFGVYKSVWDRPSLADVHRIVKATLLGTMLLVGTLFLAARGAGIPRTVFILDLLLTMAFATAARSSFQSLERLRRRLRAGEGDRLVICGAGPEADVVLKVLLLGAWQAMRPVGFVDDLEQKGTLIHGLPVLGSRGELGTILSEVGAKWLVVSSAGPGHEADKVHRTCRELGVEMLSLGVSLSPVTAVPEPQRLGSLHEAGDQVGQSGADELLQPPSVAEAPVQGLLGAAPVLEPLSVQRGTRPGR
jgi:UDP-GlcNAc:undecaprenyl-phosphate/decaprenyl-phosphate GlcNAc-1-phosphate transferase